MNPNLLQLMDAWRSLTVLVIGDVILDTYLNGASERLCREAPVPVISVNQAADCPGGAANVAANIAALGGNVSLLAAIGSDSEGRRLRLTLEQHGVATHSIIIEQQRTTLSKQRLSADSHLLIRFDQGTTAPISEATEQRLIEQLVDRFPQVDAIVVSDYGYGVLTPRIIQTLEVLQAQYHRVLVVDAKHLELYQSVGATMVKPNYGEVMQLLGLPSQAIQRSQQLEPYGDRLLQITGAAIVAVTLDTEGAIIFEQGQPAFCMSTQPVPSQQTIGAGDTFASTFALALAAGAATTNAVSLAMATTAVVVAQSGTTLCKIETLQQLFLSHSQIIWHPTDLEICMRCYRSEGRRIIFTNGCFDILHAGHVTYLTQAKELGDILIVGVNTDESVRQLKGDRRPVNCLSDRLTVLSALSCIDHLVPFAERTPRELIRIIAPDVYVKGGDYEGVPLPEAPLVEELGGTVQILPYVGDRSTTRLIQQICTIYGRKVSPTSTPRKPAQKTKRGC